MKGTLPSEVGKIMAQNRDRGAVDLETQTYICI